MSFLRSSNESRVNDDGIEKCVKRNIRSTLGSTHYRREKSFGTPIWWFFDPQIRVKSKNDLKKEGFLSVDEEKYVKPCVKNQWEFLESRWTDFSSIHFTRDGVSKNKNDVRKICVANDFEEMFSPSVYIPTYTESTSDVFDSLDRLEDSNFSNVNELQSLIKKCKSIRAEMTKNKAMALEALEKIIDSQTSKFENRILNRLEDRLSSIRSIDEEEFESKILSGNVRFANPQSPLRPLIQGCSDSLTVILSFLSTREILQGVYLSCSYFCGFIRTKYPLDIEISRKSFNIHNFQLSLQPFRIRKFFLGTSEDLIWKPNENIALHKRHNLLNLLRTHRNEIKEIQIFGLHNVTVYVNPIFHFKLFKDSRESERRCAICHACKNFVTEIPSLESLALECLPIGMNDLKFLKRIVFPVPYMRKLRKSKSKHRIRNPNPKDKRKKLGDYRLSSFEILKSYFTEQPRVCLRELILVAYDSTFHRGASDRSYRPPFIPKENIRNLNETILKNCPSLTFLQTRVFLGLPTLSGDFMDFIAQIERVNLLYFSDLPQEHESLQHSHENTSTDERNSELFGSEDRSHPQHIFNQARSPEWKEVAIDPEERKKRNEEEVLRKQKDIDEREVIFEKMVEEQVRLLDTFEGKVKDDIFACCDRKDDDKVEKEENVSIKSSGSNSVIKITKEESVKRIRRLGHALQRYRPSLLASSKEFVLYSTVPTDKVKEHDSNRQHRQRRPDLSLESLDFDFTRTEPLMEEEDGDDDGENMEPVSTPVSTEPLRTELFVAEMLRHVPYLRYTSFIHTDYSIQTAIQTESTTTTTNEGHHQERQDPEYGFDEFSMDFQDFQGGFNHFNGLNGFRGPRGITRNNNNNNHNISYEYSTKFLRSIDNIDFISEGFYIQQYFSNKTRARRENENLYSDPYFKLEVQELAKKRLGQEFICDHSNLRFLQFYLNYETRGSFEQKELHTRLREWELEKKQWKRARNHGENSENIGKRPEQSYSKKMKEFQDILLSFPQLLEQKRICYFPQLVMSIVQDCNNVGNSNLETLRMQIHFKKKCLCRIEDLTILCFDHILPFLSSNVKTANGRLKSFEMEIVVDELFDYKKVELGDVDIEGMDYYRRSNDGRNLVSPFFKVTKGDVDVDKMEKFCEEFGVLCREGVTNREEKHNWDQVVIALDLRFGNGKKLKRFRFTYNRR